MHASSNSPFKVQKAELILTNRSLHNSSQLTEQSAGKSTALNNTVDRGSPVHSQRKPLSPLELREEMGPLQDPDFIATRLTNVELAAVSQDNDLKLPKLPHKMKIASISTRANDSLNRLKES